MIVAMANSEYEHALQHLHEKHVRLTPQRKLILRYLIDHHTHPSVEMIYADLKKEADNISMATIYNTINLLVEDQLVIELKNGDGSSHYDYFGHLHYHVVCDNCGLIQDVFDDHFAELTKDLQQITRQKTNFLVSQSDIEVHDKFRRMEFLG